MSTGIRGFTRIEVILLHPPPRARPALVSWANGGELGKIVRVGMCHVRVDKGAGASGRLPLPRCGSPGQPWRDYTVILPRPIQRQGRRRQFAPALLGRACSLEVGGMRSSVDLAHPSLRRYHYTAGSESASEWSADPYMTESSWYVLFKG